MTKLPATLAEAEALEYGHQFIREAREDSGVFAIVLGEMSVLDQRAGRLLTKEALKRWADRNWQGARLVVDLANDGAGDAQDALDDLKNDYLHTYRPLPPALANYVMGPRPPRKKSKTANILLDAGMAALVEQLIRRFGLKPYRNRSLYETPENLSACAVVAIVFAEAGLHRGGEAAVEKVWRRWGPVLMAAAGRNI
jgi:hypothetical protein